MPEKAVEKLLQGNKTVAVQSCVRQLAFIISNMEQYTERDNYLQSLSSNVRYSETNESVVKISRDKPKLRSIGGNRNQTGRRLDWRYI